MNFAAGRLLRMSFILSVCLLVLPARGQPTTAPAVSGKPSTQPSGSEATSRRHKERATTQPKSVLKETMTKHEFKTEKRKRKMAKGIVREEKLEVHIAEVQKMKASQPPTTRPVVVNPRQLAEDFDWSVNWEQKNNRGAYPQVDYGYSAANHLAAAGCAPGEIGGSVAGGGISWFADDVAHGPALIDAEIPLHAAGWCVLNSTGGHANLGWFNSTTYVDHDAVPHAFLGWRQEGEAVRTALGTTGSSFVDGAAIAITAGKPFQWTLDYVPTGGDNGCGQITLRALGSSSTLSLTSQQRSALTQQKFDRFGIVASKSAAGASTLWLDNLIYTKLSGFPAPHPTATAHTRTEFFDTNPTGSTWFGVNNLPANEPTLVSQDYGYQPASRGIGHAAPGCIGGHFMRAIGASY